ncbi:MAG: flagellar hook-associated protein FlgK [Acidimicrobiales bacterium]
MSWASLQIGISGLNTARRAMEVVSENIANVNTEGYSRRRVEQAVVGRLAPMPMEIPREIEAGVKVAGVKRLRDPILDGSYRSQAAGVSGAQLRSEVAARAEEVMGPLDSGLQDAMGDFWASWERLSAGPQDLAARQEVLSSARRVATSLRGASQQVFALQNQVDARSDDVVRQLNEYGTQLATLNDQIGDAVFRGAAPNDLLDERDVLLDKVARLSTITAVEDDNGVVNVYIGSFPLVDGVTAQKIIQPPSGGPVWGIDGFPVDLSGELAAAYEAQTVTLPNVQAALDQIAHVLREVVNQQHQAGVDLKGNPGQAFFVGTSAADIDVAALNAEDIAAGATAASADNANALILARLGKQNLGVVGNVDTLLSTLNGKLGENAAATEQMARVLATSLAGLDDQRQSQMGVNLDEELSDLVRYQRAYEASARVMQIADEMLDRLINGTAV